VPEDHEHDGDPSGVVDETETWRFAAGGLRIGHAEHQV
jgi:hypothetical protein